MKFEIIPRSWFKRRDPTPEPKALSVEIPDFKKEHNSFCDMFVTYDNGEVKKYISRVVYNALNNYWTVDGTHVAVKVIE